MKVVLHIITIIIGVSAFYPTYIRAEAMKLRVVDMQKVLSDSIAGKETRALLEAEIKKETEKLKDIEAEMQKLQKEYEKQANLLSGPALAERKEQIQKKQHQFSEDYTEKRRALARKNSAEIGKIVEKANNAIRALSKEEGYAFVLERDPRVIVYSSEAIDLTDKIIAYLDEQ